METVATAGLSAIRLDVVLRSDGHTALLQVRSTVDLTQSLLLPLEGPLLGLSLSTDLGRLHALPWALAYGVGMPSEHCVVHFSTGSLRLRRERDVSPVRLGGKCWVAGVEGVFSSAALITDGVESARVLLNPPAGAAPRRSGGQTTNR